MLPDPIAARGLTEGDGNGQEEQQTHCMTTAVTRQGDASLSMTCPAADD